MNINKKYIIIFGTLILSLIIITGAITYYNEDKEQSQILDVEHSILSFSQPNPADSKEFLDLINFCKNARFSNIQELKDSQIKEIACVIVKILPEYIDLYTSSNKPFLPLVFPLKSILFFESGRYVSISVDLKDIIREHDPSFLEKERLYFCNISEPSWEDLFYLEIAPKQNLFFPEGNIGCAELIMDKTPAITFSGFIPDAESLNIKLYLVDKQTVSDVMDKQSFLETKETLEDYPIIWQMEKPINL